MGQVSERIHPESDQAIFPADMLALIPPPGTIMYELGIRRGKDEHMIFRFGVRDMALGLIRTFDEQHGSTTKYKEGTFIQFDPGNIHAHVIRRSLTGEEVNTIGTICADIDNALFISGFLPKALSQAEELINRLQTLSIPRTGSQESQDANLQLKENISDLGVVVDRLKTSKIEQDEHFHKLIEKANILGITLITSSTGSGNSTAIPLIKKPLKKTEVYKYIPQKLKVFYRCGNLRLNI